MNMKMITIDVYKRQGEKFALERHKQVADITKEMLESGEEIVLKPFVFLFSFIVDTISVPWERSLRAVICILC